MEKNKDYSLLFIRIALAIVFVIHGWLKFSGLEAAGEAFGSLGAPMPHFLAFVAAVIEFFGGIAILLGLYSRIAAGLIACTMATAIFSVHFADGFVGGYEYPFVLLFVALAVVFGGPGKMTINYIINKK